MVSPSDYYVARKWDREPNNYLTDAERTDARFTAFDALLGSAAMALGPDEPPPSAEPSRPVTP